ncbi:hypothetical protein BDF21DRAFT_455878 [Thamnidium elegans]|nr:hypothetical protein BDF21DRAFT_455878 [Thamnidium elegans]
MHKVLVFSFLDMTMSFFFIEIKPKTSISLIRQIKKRFMTTTLGQISLPDKEIEHVFSSHDALSQPELLNVFQIIINKISNGLESIHLATFTLEQQVNQDDYFVKDLEPLENSMVIMEPLIQVLSDLSDIIFNKGDQNIMQQQQQQIKITRIQSEWSSLQHFLASVKKQVITSNNEKELTKSIELLIIQIDDISTMIFDFQEKKHASISTASSTSSNTSELESSSTTTTTTTDFSMDTKWLQNSKDDQLMIAIDNAFEPLLQSIEQIYHRINSMQIIDTRLNRIFDKVKEKWEILQYERDELKFEHKEDRWLAVFRRVADKVDAMIDGLDRSVVQCYNLIQQTRDWQATQPTSTFDKFSKSFLRSIHPHHHPTTTTQPVDKDQFKSIEKSFEAKYKYYTPSIDRMLTMLGNGIAARATRDNPTSQRHDTMIIRWNNLKEVMDELRMRDLIETERIISATTSSSSSIHSTSTENNRNGWKNIRYRTPEPSFQQQLENRSVRSITPNSASDRNSIGRSSPRKSSTSTFDHQSLLRGSISDSSSVGSSPSQQQQQTRRQTKTPRPTRNGSITTKRNTEDFYDEDERNYGVDLMKLSNPTRPPSVNTRRSQPLNSIVRSKTPNPPTTRTNNNRNNTIRSKSSMGDLMTNRVMSPSNLKRSVTPSFIPRPKTPKEDSIRSASPMIPRPKSQLRNNNFNKPPPPVPPIPKYVISHETEYASYRDPNLVLRKKQSMPALRNRASNTTMEISFSEDAIYHPDPKDPLDIEVGQIVNASPISIKCQKAQPGRYYFGNELSMSSMGGKKMYTCKLMTYGDRRGGQFKNNKVLIRVGGGWQDLEFFLLEHSSLMASDVVVRSFQSNRNTSWR